MPSMFRAGLVSLFLFLTLVGLASSVPLSERPYSVIARHENDLAARSIANLFSRELDFENSIFPKRDSALIFDDRDVGLGYDEHAKRSYGFFGRRSELSDSPSVFYKRDGSETHILYRRRSIFTKIRDAFRHAFHKIGQGFKKFGQAVKKGFQKAGHAIKTGFQKFGQKVKTGFQKFGQKVKQGFKKVGKVLKKGFQKGLSIAAKGLAKGADIASNKIHASLGKKLDKAMHGMDYVISPIGTAAKAAGKKVGAGAVVADLLT
ncbi:hypothetical protein CPB84DRAFT_153543 [Gymnopilus junonius]|uniref:Uncharacterized protein n=1 Tax=Gymnopilus junonius TaxID=109634 RepID=A0A9P5NH36_GYMJU|nr:hypothetical protein CPB84DRAFT_153543 [Gymnopilus junonius]